MTSIISRPTFAAAVDAGTEFAAGSAPVYANTIAVIMAPNSAPPTTDPTTIPTICPVAMVATVGAGVGFLVGVFQDDKVGWLVGQVGLAVG
jgi:hypothetical protein